MRNKSAALAVPRVEGATPSLVSPRTWSETRHNAPGQGQGGSW